MSNYIQIACPNCHNTLRVREEYIGKKVACKRCSQPFKVTPSDAAPAPAPMPSASSSASDVAALAALRQELETTRSQVAAERAGNASLRSQVAESLRQAQEYQAECDQLRTEVEALRLEPAGKNDHATLLGQVESQRDEALALSARLREDLEGLYSEQASLQAGLAASERALAEASAKHEEDRVRWDQEQGARQSAWDEERRTLADEAERRLSAERDRLEGEHRGRLDQHEAEFRRTSEERDALRLDRERLGDEIRTLKDHVADLERERDEARRQLDEERRTLADEAERRLSAERDRLEGEHRGRLDQHEAEFRRASEEHDALRLDCERLGDEIRTLKDFVADLERERDEARRQLEEATGTCMRLEGERNEARQRFETLERELEQFRASHREDLAQLGEEFDTIRRDRDRLAALHDEAGASHGVAIEAVQAELARLSDDRDQHRRQAETESSRAEVLSAQLRALTAELEQLQADRQTHERELAALRDERDAARRLPEPAPPAMPTAQDHFDSVLDDLLADSSPVPSPPKSAPITAPVNGETEQRLAEVQSEFAQVDEARSALNDALRAARREIHELKIDLNEARQEQQRVRNILDSMGIHLI